MLRRDEEPVRSNYARYCEAAFNQLASYPVVQQLDPARYYPLGAWMGRLILPTIHERAAVMGAWFEVYHAPEEQRRLVGTRVRLRWNDTPDLNARLWGITRTVVFNDDAWEAVRQGMVLGERLHGLSYVNPLESLAGAHPADDMLVRLDGPVGIVARPADGYEPILLINRMPVEISGTHYALVRFLGPSGDKDGYRVRHYNAAGGDFDGPEEVVSLPEVIPDSNGVRNSTAAGIERSPCNALGWYIYGMQDRQGRFVVRAIAARQLLRFDPAVEVVAGTDEAKHYLRPGQWKHAIAKGQATQALLVPNGVHPDAARSAWREGERLLLIHMYGGIGGAKTEPAVRTPFYWGHMTFGIATLIREPLANELIFDIVYHQIYTHNPDGLTAGAVHYSRYAGDRQFGWAGVRPIQDLVVRHEALSGSFAVGDAELTALEEIEKQLEVMAGRYRIGDGHGGTWMGALNNCAQDSAQALYTALRHMTRLVAVRTDSEMTDASEEASRLKALQALGDALQRILLPWGSARPDWEYGTTWLGSREGRFLSTIGDVLKSWRTMLPPVAVRSFADVFLERRATIYVLRTHQIGGDDPELEPIVPHM